MPDTPSKPPSIPSWQRQPGNAPIDQSPSPSPDPGSDSAPTSTTRQDLLDQAAKFLQDESIRDAPTDRKVSFLESKGLTSDEIQKLLGVSRNLEASSSDSTAAEGEAQEEALSPSPDQPVSSSSSVNTPSPSDPMSQKPSTMASTASPSASRDVPPIITYPEFLLQSSKPPPLVTMRNVLSTIYVAAGLGTSIYGASEYFVKPMLANLTDARHELAATAQENLQKLNDKLEQNVSVSPPQLTPHKHKHLSDEDEIGEAIEDEDDDSATSDPTELFHRDVATQTSPEFSQTPVSVSTDTSPAADKTPTAAVTTHLERLESMHTHLKELVSSERNTGSLDDSTHARLADLRHYLDGLIYTAPSYSAAMPSYGAYSGNASTGLDSSAAGVRKSEDDAIASFRTEIRGVKGALLSARNFPASRGGRIGGAPGLAR